MKGPEHTDRSVRQIDAQREDTVAFGGSMDAFTYRVLCDASSAGSGGDRRSGPRQRTRLRSGKIVARDGRFLTECLIANRSAFGGRLRLPGLIAVPPHFWLYDDQFDCLFQATVVWRKEREIGVRFFVPANTARHRAIAESMRRKFYSVGR